MHSRKPERGDEENNSFELSESVLEQIKPGSTYGDEKGGGTGATHAPGTEGHHRLTPRQRKDIPQESLAARIRKASKGG